MTLHRVVTLLDASREHAESYNQLVEVVARNLLLADWHDDSHTESLLAPRNAKCATPMQRRCTRAALHLLAMLLQVDVC